MSLDTPPVLEIRQRAINSGSPRYVPGKGTFAVLIMATQLHQDSRRSAVFFRALFIFACETAL